MTSLTLSLRTAQSIQSGGSQQGATEPLVDISHTRLEMFWVVTEESADGIYLEEVRADAEAPRARRQQTASTTETQRPTVSIYSITNL